MRRASSRKIKALGRRHIILLCLLPLSTFSNSSALAQNLVQDPSFEARAWSSSAYYSINPFQARTGSNSSYFADASAPLNIFQAINLKSGSYLLSYWLAPWSINPGITIGSVTVTPSLAGIVGTGRTYTSFPKFVNFTPISYTQYNDNFTLTVGGSLLLSFLSTALSANNSVVEIDDVSLICVSGDCALPTTLAPSLPGGAPTNAIQVVGAIDAFTNSGGTTPSGFGGLYALTGSALVNALQQLAGEPGASGGVEAGYQLTNSLLGMLTTFGGDGSGPAGGGVPLSYAPEPTRSAEAERAYAALDRAAGIDKPHHGPWSVWASGYGGQATINGDAATGANDTRTGAWGTAAGASYRLSPDTMLGFALAGGGTNWSVANGFGGGKGNAVQIAGYARQQFGASYVSGALAYGWHWMNTNRTVTVSGTDVLAADFSAQNLAGRIETGHRFALAPFGITPYAALQTQAFWLPGYSESATSGSNQFALTYASRTATDTRAELGSWFDASLQSNLKLFTRLAWAHDWRSDASVTAGFQTLPGSNFVVSGAAAPEDAGLVTAGVNYALNARTSLTGKFEGEFGSGYRSYAGMGTLKVVFN